ncbi:MAG: helicase associated domain-containing protein [Alistipes sp.]|nr:helicase associated domain-containing protein [Candidatus Alistipes equi]
MFNSLWSNSPIEHIQDLAYVITGRATSLSKRGKDAFYTLYQRCDENVATLAYTLITKDFSWSTYHHNIGEKTLNELKSFAEDIIELINAHKSIPGLEEWDIYKKKCKLSGYISVDETEKILQMERSLGYFPVAALVHAWITSSNERDYFFYRHGFSIWKDAQEKQLASIAEQHGIVYERCRQIRNDLFSKLVVFLRTIKIDNPCPYNFLDKELDCVVNEVEHTAFNANFIRFILGSSYQSLHVVGDTERSLLVKMKGGTDDAFVAAIPRQISENYDFNSFLASIETRNAEKRTEVQYLPLPEWSQNAKDIAVALASLRYGWAENEGKLQIPPNANKNLPDIMEDILRDAGHPLTIDEIIEEYAKRYPYKKAYPTIIRASMQRNPRIVPIGRSGVYSIDDWNSGKERGGTIRSFVREYLDKNDTRIVPVKEVSEYVLQFRPTTTDKNIITNLMLETDKSFRIIWKDGISYLNYSSDPIPEGYKQYTNPFSERRSFEENIALLDQFISLNGKAPKVCKDPNQTRLARFLSNLKSSYRRGLLSQDRVEELQRVESKINDDCIQLELF